MSGAPYIGYRLAWNHPESAMQAGIVHSTGLPKHCTPTSPYLERISSAFNTCVPTSLALLSTALGIFSIVAWLFAQLPQIYKNYRLKSASGLSIYFLGEWLFGDVTNLIGALLTGQASWQIGIATYYCIVDVCLSSQYLWYTHVKVWRKKEEMEYIEGEGDDEDAEDDGNGVRRAIAVVPPSDDRSSLKSANRKGSSAESQPNDSQLSEDGQPKTAHAPLTSIEWNEKLPAEPSEDLRHLRQNAPRTITLSSHAPILFSLANLAATAVASPVPSSRATFSTANASSSSAQIQMTGRIFSWISTLLYLGSRLPQIYKNAQRRSTAGLSPYMFLAAFTGNFLYSAAIIANPLAWASYPPYGAHGWVGREGSDRSTWVGLAAPFWLGAAGVLVLDATVGLQFLAYRGEERGEVEVLVEDERGRSKWRAVKGWMRGWIPSPSPSVREVEEARDGEPLLARRMSSRRRSSGYGAT
ncbi:MAG: hypothetical protein OHK93_007135 [Ramalina farinacea]|uniref:Uncharacterized protein n=1 Tax=Ramalina farinacea TaxID=258253 RepID=A0AA43TXC1_9LECA|nr:hypothetical protein [Ramalina farinacea]